MERAALQREGGAKRMRLEGCCSTSSNGQDTQLLDLPPEVLSSVLTRVSAHCLVSINATCKALHARDNSTGLRLVEKVARDKVLALCCGEEEEAARWR